jgi:hypothetical protein
MGEAEGAAIVAGERSSPSFAPSLIPSLEVDKESYTAIFWETLSLRGREMASGMSSPAEGMSSVTPGSASVSASVSGSEPVSADAPVVLMSAPVVMAGVRGRAEGVSGDASTC